MEKEKRKFSREFKLKTGTILKEYTLAWDIKLV